MSSHHFIGLDPDEMTPRQLRMALRQAASIAALRATRKGKKDEEPEEEDSAEEESKENDDLVDLHEEQKGDSKPPKVTKDDLPKGVNIAKDEKPSKDKNRKDS